MKINFWKKKRVFITGHTGFVGTWLCFTLNLFGSIISGYALKPNKNQKLFKLLNIKNIIHDNKFSDIANKKEIFRHIKKNRPEIIFHLAAQSLVFDSYYNPSKTYNTNIMGLVNLLDVVKKFKFIKCVIIVTSDKCYKIKKKLFYNENDELGGNDPYSSSKACQEIIYNSFNFSFFKNRKINISSVRSGNIIGGGDWSYKRLIPDIIRCKFYNKKLKIRNINSVRPWLHVFDSLNGYITLAEKLYNNKKYVGSWNFGPNKRKYSTKYIINYCINNNILKKKEILKSKKNFLETSELTLSSKKSNILLNWRPKLDFISTLKYTFDWYKCYYHNQNVKKFSYSQIKEFYNLK